MTDEAESQEPPLIGVINEGTETASFVVISTDKTEEIAFHSIPIRQICPRDGWQEQDPMEILGAVKECITKTLRKMEDLKIAVDRIVTLGITNQRETSILWNKNTGMPLYNAIVWSDIRTDAVVDAVLARVAHKNALKPLCGLPISPYFSALKIRWLIDNVPAVQKAIREEVCMFGTVDTWLIWNLTGGKDGGLHITDVTNASRTMLMNIETLEWDPVLCRYLQIPMSILPKICSSSEIYGSLTVTALKGVPISGILGNQQSSLVGELCLKEGDAKNTYRSGCFLMYNTGRHRVLSTHGLVTTVAYKMGKSAPAVYALEGSVAVAGAAVNWLKNNMNLLANLSDIEALADEVKTTGDVYFVPAFSGLYAPYWRKDARGIICGLTQFTTKNHIIRACLEAVCFQTHDILEAMRKDCGIPLKELKVDGPMTQNDLLMQLQADICGISVSRSSKRDVSSLGAAMVAGQAEGIDLWKVSSIQDKHPKKLFVPQITVEERVSRYNKWKMAVHRSLGWVTAQKAVGITDERYRLLASIPPSWFLMTSFGMLVLAKQLVS